MMDFFTMPDPSETNFAYAYIVLIIVFLATYFTVRKLKKSNEKAIKEQEKLEAQAYELFEEERK
ncbi:hypothetical protein LGQ02_05510 [Bacillus shivajii]|uniref:hypothetical protein n=1 Tax=Bacillus shivajii TaxID=1983719 RepID=UPI001CFA7493|nr:hypothetical protein [Bacillus shivajii]UCZ54219.1 hypothetical protein LGQ02_05510 [Bacillus shivajii]